MVKLFFLLLLSFSLFDKVEAETKNRRELIKEERLKQHQANIEFRNAQLEKRKAFIAEMDKEEEAYIKSGKRDPNHRQERIKKRNAFNEQMKKESEARRLEQKKMREARHRR